MEGGRIIILIKKTHNLENKGFRRGRKDYFFTGFAWRIAREM